ncbi:hypothetical protein [Curtobacterium sp. VKM Ac-2922]|uniref:hypothetical protein n=1 Tax=Curtobacterium sp. VKM Ac-2922 TaxID=2929475 RepID=UPI001FB2AD34|nr:hypothetical protein [Curtobacterium sp. VKM Ac-2922]MCJ1715244.1 hypothetical protein [Curtobacterium sp. VKM Ac-2922]
MEHDDSTAVTEEFEGGWFVVDGEVEYLDDVVWVPATERSARIVGGEPRAHVGSTLPLATSTELGLARRSTVRRLWTMPIAIVVAAVVFGALELSGVPWRSDLGRQLVVGVAAGIPTLAVALGAWTLLTRDAAGGVVRAMGGHRTREQYERQRALVGDAD